MNMMIVNFDPFPNILTDRLLLRKLHSSDVSDILFLRSDPRVLAYMDTSPMDTIDDAREWQAKTQLKADNNDLVEWGISLRSDSSEKLIGMIAFWRILKDDFRAEIGYRLHPDYFRQGIMSEAMEAVLNYGFTTMNLHSVEANINPSNEASKKLLEEFNFVKEAHFKENIFFNGKFLDSAIYSLIKPI